MKCLIAVDGSPGSLQAVRMAGMLLDSERDEVVLYSSPPAVRLRSDTLVDPLVLDRARRALADSVFAQSAEQLPALLTGRLEKIVGEHAAGVGILAAAADRHADLIVLGARGHGLVKSLLLGSTSLHVAAHASVPVLIVRGNVPRTGDGVRALLACTCAAAGRTHIPILRQIHWPEGSQGRAMVVVETPFGGEVPGWLQAAAHSPEAEQLAHEWVVEHERELAAQHAALDGLCRDLPAPFHGTESVVVEGHPAERIIATADATMSDLIVIGTHPQSSIALALLGSTAFKVLTHAHCSVLLLPDAAKA